MLFIILASWSAGSIDSRPGFSISCFCCSRVCTCSCSCAVFSCNARYTTVSDAKSESCSSTFFLPYRNLAIVSSISQIRFPVTPFNGLWPTMNLYFYLQKLLFLFSLLQLVYQIYHFNPFIHHFKELTFLNFHTAS